MALREIRKLRVLRKYEIIRKVFVGAQAVLYKANHRDTGASVAIKVYDLKHGSSKAWDGELAALQQCQHIPGVIRLLEHETTSRYGLLITEWCPGGSLATLDLMQRDHSIDAVVLFLYRTVSRIHAAGITHGDIKPENILIRSVAFESEMYALCDFGMCRPAEAAPGPVSGTPDFIAPELLRNPSVHTDFKIDIWMVGILLYESVTGDPPFFDTDIDSTFRNIQIAPANFDHAGFEARPHLRDFVSLLLVKDPEQRPSFPDLRSHPYLRRLLYRERCPQRLSARFAARQSKLRPVSLRTTTGSADSTASRSTVTNDSRESSESEKKARSEDSGSKEHGV